MAEIGTGWQVGDGIAFTSRYGGNEPSWLQACLGHCEAMGVIPVYVRQREPAAEWNAFLPDEEDPVLRAAWERLHHGIDQYDPPHDCDGWHFVECPSCGGTGRVGWATTIRRIPRWLWRGVKFYGFAMGPSISPEGWSWRRRFRNYVYAAYGADLARLRR